MVLSVEGRGYLYPLEGAKRVPRLSPDDRLAMMNDLATTDLTLEKFAKKWNLSVSSVLYAKRRLGLVKKQRGRPRGKRVEAEVVTPSGESPGDGTVPTVEAVESSEDLEFLRAVRDNPEVPWNVRSAAASTRLKLTGGPVEETWTPPADEDLWAGCLADLVMSQPEGVRAKVLSLLSPLL